MGGKKPLQITSMVSAVVSAVAFLLFVVFLPGGMSENNTSVLQFFDVLLRMGLYLANASGAADIDTFAVVFVV